MTNAKDILESAAFEADMLASKEHINNAVHELLHDGMTVSTVCAALCSLCANLVGLSAPPHTWEATIDGIKKPMLVDAQRAFDTLQAGKLTN